MIKQHKYFLWILLMLATGYVVSAQTKESMYLKISDCILRNYHPDSLALAKSCSSGCIFIKFRVNQRGDVDSLSLGGNTDSVTFIKNALIFSVQMLKQDTRLTNFLKQSGKFIVQPFMYDYRVGCRISEPGSKSNSEYYLSYIKMLSGLVQTSYTSMHDMLKFDGKRLTYIDGIMLEPIEVDNVALH